MPLVRKKPLTHSRHQREEKRAMLVLLATAVGLLTAPLGPSTVRMPLTRGSILVAQADDSGLSEYEKYMQRRGTADVQAAADEYRKVRCGVGSRLAAAFGWQLGRGLTFCWFSPSRLVDGRAVI